MSWEEMYRREYPCSCGKGTYTEVSKMDDWNRRREFRVMNCLICAENERAEEAKIREEREQLNTLAKEIKTYFTENYLQEWLNFFGAAKTKKKAWEIAKEIGVETDSLSSFYSRKYYNIEKYIESLTTYTNIDKIVQVLNIYDNELMQKIKEAIRLSNYETKRSINDWYNDH
ncbi:hypothetical protein LRR81_01410 [Metabacillus sp. GX 13764]|uniref:hypothetical protein n=1 Tax=Metabacillus kandeliae TaxID=2900151 RepID=UPI001E633B29|nr:hypothetical protein [Metabacillus kandeliae]MCD7032868.1 hypothetical protein [Metabacillus kandeliae]